MRFLYAMLLGASLILAASTEAASTTDDGKSTVTDEPTTPSTTASPEPTVPTTTPVPSTSSAAPSSSTSAPSSTTPEPSSTTPAPSTTTTEPTPTPKPKPKEPTLGHYEVEDKENNGTFCLVMEMKVTLTQNKTRIPLINGTVLSEGSSCGAENISLFLQFENGNLQLNIQHDNTSFYIERIMVDAFDGADKENLKQFATPKNEFYKCMAASEVTLDKDVRVIFSSMKFQAFKASAKSDFVGSEFECVSDYHSDVVIIAIGCALALLVVVILFAYLIARRKNRQRGYQSV